MCFVIAETFDKAIKIKEDNDLNNIEVMLWVVVVNLDVMMAKGKYHLKIWQKNRYYKCKFINFKTGKAKAIRFTTLNEICKALDCQPGDILEYVEDG